MKSSSFALFGLVLAAASFSGCASTPQKKQTQVHQPAVVSVGIQPAVQGYPQPPAPSGQMPGVEGYEAESVYRAPVVRKINLEPYVDAEGNAYGPQVKYQVEDPGGWNTNALRNPSRAYVPSNMAPNMPAPAGYVVASTGEDPVPVKTKSLRQLYNLDDVEVTGFVERGQEPLVAELEQKKGGTHVRYFDADLGWLLVPKAALSKVQG